MAQVASPVLVGVLLACASSFAQSQQRATDDWVQARVRYGTAFHQGTQATPQPGLSYAGFSPLDLEAGAAIYPWQHLGFAAFGRLDRYGIFEGDTRVGRLQLPRFEVAPEARFRLGPTTLHLAAGYSYAALPRYDANGVPDTPLERHAAMVGTQIAVHWQPLRLEVGGAFYPSLRGLSYASGYTAGAGLHLRILRLSATELRLGVEYQLSSDEAKLGGDSVFMSDLAHRAGLVVAAAWTREVPSASPVLPTGSLQVQVVDAVSGQPLPSATVELNQAGAPRKVALDPQGRGEVSALLEGTVTVRAVLDGHLPQQGSTVIPAHGQAELKLALHKAPPSTGGLLVRVVDGASELGLPGAVVRVQEVDWMTNEAGEVLLSDLQPAPTEVAASLEAYQTGRAVAQVSAGVQSNVTVYLLKAALKQSAVIKGQVRSSDDGTPVEASIAVAQGRLKTQSDANGAFTLSLAPGTYSIRISASGYRPQTKSVTVKTGERAIFNVDLHPR